MATTVRTLVTDDGFIAKHWGREPLFVPAAEVLDPPATAEQIFDLLRSPALRPPYLRVIMPKTGLLPKELYTTSRKIGHGWADDALRPEVIADAFRRGATLVLDEVQDYLPEARRCCESLSTSLGLRFHASVFITPPGNQGLNLHFDRDEVFVHQLAGAKAWRVHRQLDPLRPEPRTLKEDVGEAVVERVLEPGDMLYVPVCAPHVASAVDSTSVHLTIAARPPAWSELLSELCHELAEQYEWSGEFPVGPPDTSQYADEFASYAGQLAGALDAFNPAAVLGRLLAKSARPEPGTAALADLLEDLDSVTRCEDDHLTYRLTPGVVIDGPDPEGRLRLTLRDRQVALPAGLRPLLDRLADGASPGSLAALLPGEGALTRTLGTLVLQGFVRTDRGDR
jgi:hypothetical protein